MTDYVIAADGGNSKTDLVLSTVDGEVLAQVQGGGTHPHITGMDRTAEDLAAMVAQVRERAGLPASATIGVGAFYLANVDVAADDVGEPKARQDISRRSKSRFSPVLAEMERPSWAAAWGTRSFFVCTSRFGWRGKSSRAR